MKLTQEQAKDLLGKLGVADVEIDNNSTEEVNIDELLGTVDTARLPVLKAKILPELEEEIKVKTSGKLHNLYRQALKKNAGLSESEVKDLELEDLVKLVTTKLKTSGDQSAEQVKETYQRLLSEKEAEIPKLKGEYEAKIAALEDKEFQRELDEAILKKVSKYPLLPSTDKAKVIKILKSAIGQSAAIVREGDEVKLRKLDNKANPILKGNTVWEFDDAAKEELDSLGLWQKDTRNVKSTTSSVFTNVVNDDKQYTKEEQASGLADLEREIANMK